MINTFKIRRTSKNLILLIIVMFVSQAKAQVTWDGSESTDWNTAANWDSNVVPTQNDDVIIPATSVTFFRAPNIAASEFHEIRNLTIQANGRVEIGDGSSSGAGLTVNGNISNEGLLRANANSSMKLLGSYNGSGMYANSRTVYGDLSYSIFSIPYSSANLGLFNGVFSFDYDNSTGEYIPLDFSDAAVPGKGYFVAINSGGGFGSNTFSLGFAGIPIDDDVNLNISTGTSDNFNLVGNPYTAAINVNDFLANTNNMNNTTGVIYLWDDGGSNTGSERAGDYITVNSMGTVGTNNLGDGVAGIKGTTVYNGNITAMQGFFVEATTNGNVSFTQDMQVIGNDEDIHFYRSETAIDERTKIKFSLRGNGHYNEALVGFDENATVGNDYSLDAKKLIGNSDLSLYSLSDDEKYAIQALPELSGESYNVPIAFDVSQKGVYRLSVEEVLNIPFNYTVELVDLVTRESYDLSQIRTITFETEETTKDVRFELLLSPAEVSLTDHGLKDELTIVSIDDSGLEINYKEGLEEVSIYDLNGKSVFQKTIFFRKTLEKIPVTLEKGRLYVVKIGDDRRKIFYR